MIQSNREPEVLVGLVEIADFLRVSTKRLRRWIDQHPDMPVVKDGAYYSNRQALGRWHAEFVAGRCRFFD